MSGVNVEDSGVRCQVSGKRNIGAETCWSEAEIPSEAKRQQETLKPTVLVPASAVNSAGPCVQCSIPEECQNLASVYGGLDSGLCLLNSSCLLMP